MMDTNCRCSTCKNWTVLPSFSSGQGQCGLDGVWMDFDEWCDDWTPDAEYKAMEETEGEA